MSPSNMQIEEAVASLEAMLGPDSDVSAEGTKGNVGEFLGLPVRVEFDLDGRTGKLLEPISYIDPAQQPWPVPKDAWLDGASIPRPFWSLIGGPFEGKYREPSIVHDHYCIVKNRPWEDTHRMFYNAMLCRGVSGLKARVMFYAVYRFGPRWSLGVTPEGTASARPDSLTDATAASIVTDTQLIMAKSLSLKEIEQLADAH